MQALRRIWENADLAAKRSFDSRVLIPLSLFPPELPPVPSSYRAWRCVPWTGFALFQVPWESGTGVSQRKGASSFPSARALPWWARSWELPTALGWLCKHHPQEMRCSPTVPWGPAISPAPTDCRFILAWLWDLHAQHWQEQGKPVGFASPIPGMQTPSTGRRWGGWCNSCRRRHRHRQMCRDMSGQPHQHLSHSWIQPWCGGRVR